MKNFRISTKKDYKVTGLTADGKNLGTMTDSGFRSLADLTRTYERRMGRSAYIIRILCLDDDTYEAYRVTENADGDLKFARSLY